MHSRLSVMTLKNEKRIYLELNKILVLQLTLQKDSELSMQHRLQNIVFDYDLILK